MARAGLNKEKIIEFAARKANEVGISNVRLRGLATELGVQPASLYSHVKNFDELKIGIMNYGWKQLEHNMIQDIAGVSGYEAIRVMCRSFYSYAVQNPGIFEVMLWYNKYVSDENNNATDDMFDVLYRIFKSVNISKENAEHIIRTFRSFLQGFVMLVNNHSFGNPVSIEKSFEMSVEILIAGIKTFEDKKKNEF